MAVPYYRHVSGKPQGFVHIMRHEDDRLAAAGVNTAQFIFLQRYLAHWIERRKWLIHQDNVGIGGERSGNADALLLTARQLPWIAVEKGRIDLQQSDKRIEPRGTFRWAPLSRRGTARILSAAVQWGNSPADWIT